MSSTASAPPATRLTRHALFGVVAGGLIVSAAMGVRQTFGLFVAPFSFDHGLPVTLIAFAIALHNLVWGVAQPFAGAAADRYGAGPVVAFGALLFAAGLAVAALFPTGPMLVLGLGLLVGAGISCTSFGVVLTAVSRAVPAEKRSMALGLSSACGSLGQMLLVPLAQGVSQHSGTAVALMVLAGCVLAVAPFGVLLDRRDPAGAAPAPEGAGLPLGAALAQAMRHPGFRLLTLGFFNMIGSWACGWLGGRFRQQYVLGWLYLIRGIAIAAFFLLPKSEASVLVFAAIMGLIWLGTVPLTSGLVAKVFGVRHLGTLFGICFLSHQIGSFLGSWVGGYVFDATGSYSLIWIATAGAGLVAALLHFPIKDLPVAAPATA
ncbi:MFS transporter [Roseomonas marmotae]|uniref:MFS transporter n=1 Tax=Roseomonas marmotae TaxID=2768161 RepID=A0ABS3KB07_9PROT|nr:MFS transporter [Roseomonas marmotae]MBO1074636.1 MFS transporter [Roseomonas marmotae]QTI81657.1 MFS transporter [Roseomonas marmotae]